MVLRVDADGRRGRAAPALALRLFKILDGLVVLVRVFRFVDALPVVRPDHSSERVQRYPV